MSLFIYTKSKITDPLTEPKQNGLTREEMAAIKASEKEAKAAQKAKEKEARQFERDTAKVCLHALFPKNPLLTHM